MAIIHHPGRASGPGIKKQIGLVLIIALTLGGLMSTQSPDLSDNTTIVITSLAVAAFFTLVALKKNPLAWIRIPRNTNKNKDQALKAQIFSGLAQLGDQYQVFQSLTLEFFKIDFLIIAPQGIFVIKAASTGTDKDTRVMDRETAKLWQRCHMINMLIKKGYDRDLMPVPLAAIQTEDKFEHNGVQVIAPQAIPGLIQTAKSDLDMEMVTGFTEFIKTRYLV